MNILTPEQIANFPVAHLSPSSIRKYLENPHGFFKNYVRYEYDESVSPALLEGDCMHKIIAEYYDEFTKPKKDRKKFDWDEAIDRVFIETFNPDSIKNVSWGKTGSLEKSRQIVDQSIDSYRSELPEIDHVVSVEERFLIDFEDLNNVPMPIPIKGFTDLVVSGDGDSLVIRDHKFVSFFSDPDNIGDIAKYEMQAAPYFFMVRKRYGKNPECMIFDEVKKSKNRDGSPQRKEVVVVFTPMMLNRWLEIYKRVVRSLVGIPLIDPVTGVMQFLPNPFAQFAEDAWRDFCDEVDTGRVWTFDQIKEIRSSKFSRAEEMEALF